MNWRVWRVLMGGLALLTALLLVGCGGGGADLPTATPGLTPTAGVSPAAASVPGASAMPTPRPTARPTIPPLTVTARPTLTPTAPAVGATAPPVAAAVVPAAPERDLYRLAAELMPGAGDAGSHSIAEGHGLPLRVGDVRSFKLVNLRRLELYESDFVLRLVTPHAYWFVEDGLAAAPGDIERSAALFEDAIYPRVTGVFGREWTPGIDGDPRLYILNADLAQVGGYFSPDDEYPQSIRPVSNEIEAVYMNARYLRLGTPEYGYTLAHELHHAIQWHADSTEDAWVYEGLAELAVTIAGLPGYGRMVDFPARGPVSLTVWPAGGEGLGDHYAAASSFMHYMTEHYGGRDDLRPLLAQQSDGIDGVNAYLESGGHQARFREVFRDWAAANLLDADSGIYSHGDVDVARPQYRVLRLSDAREASIPQYATEYYLISGLQDGAARLSFDGADAAPLLPAEAGGGCWWGNNGDAINATLTRALDLRRARDPVFTYQVWYAIEDGWDYAYLEVSADGGETWRIIETPLSSDANPVGAAFGPGYTGNSGGWRDEAVSLAEWAGREILLRFQYITDAAANDHGLCVRNAAAQGVDRAAVGEWTPDGFFWNGSNLVRQGFMVHAVYAGDENRVVPLELDDGNRGDLILERGPDSGYIVVMVQALAPSTRLPGEYTLMLEPLE